MNAKQTNKDKIIVHSCFKHFCFAKLIRRLCYISAYENSPWVSEPICYMKSYK